MSVIESMARGMPVLASKASEGVFAKSGRIIEIDAHAYSEAMEGMLEGNEWEKMAASGPTESEKYRLENVMPMWGKLYDEVAV